MSSGIRLPQFNGISDFFAGTIIVIYACILLLCTAQVTQAQMQLSGLFENSWQQRTDFEGNVESIRNPGRSEYNQNYELNLSGHLLSYNFLSYRLRSRYRESQKTRRNSFSRQRRLGLYDLSAIILRNQPLNFQVYISRDQVDNFPSPRDDFGFQQTTGLTLSYSKWGWPRTRIGYQLISGGATSERDYQFRLGTIELNSGSKNGNAQLLFRDEQNTYSSQQRGSHSQEIRLKTSSAIWQESTKIRGEILFNNRSSSQNLRNSLRLTGRYRERDILNVYLSSFSTYSGNSSSFQNQVTANYRRQLKPQLTALVDASIQRSLNKSLDRASRRHNISLNTGGEYFRMHVDSLVSRRDQLSLLINYRDENNREAGLGLNSRLSVDNQVILSRHKLFSYGANSSLAYRRAHGSPYSWTSILYTELQLRPFSRVVLRNRVGLHNQEGFSFNRNVFLQGDLGWSPGQRLSFQSNYRFKREFAPHWLLFADWNNYMTWAVGRNLKLRLQSTVSYDGSRHGTSRRYAAILDATFRMMTGKFETRYEDNLGLGNLSVFFRLTRKIGKSHG